MLFKIKDPISSFTHLFGAALAVPCAALLIITAAKAGSTVHVAAFAIFGAALFLLYMSSGIYHLLPLGKHTNIFRRIDHMMIFVLIAGTYTPICLIPLKGAWGITMLALIWVCALCGVIIKVFWFDAPRKLSTCLYVFMGWLIVIAFYPLSRALPPQAILLLAGGGLLYSTGAIIYATKRPRLKIPFFGFHEIFHLFVLAGSAFHVAMMFKYIAPH